jgi:tRNA threonylcarbamoyladenosine biosynthesis protein TsaB
MLIVGLDTAGEHGSIGLAREADPVSEITFPAAFQQGEKLLPALDGSLKLAEITRSDVGLLAVSMGPGSFTGLRIGIALAKGLARALGIPIVGVSAFDAYASTARFWEGPVWVLLSDRRDWVYVAAFHEGEQIIPAGVSTIDSLLVGMQESRRASRPKALFIGPGAELHRLRLAEQQGIVAPALLNRPSGLQIARLGWEKHRQFGQDELYDLEPAYIQPPAAEMAWEVPLRTRKRQNRVRQ